MDRNEAVLRLVKKISDGKCTYSKTSRILDSIERKYGSIDMLCEVEERQDKEYLQILVSDARMGIYSRESILKMASINDQKSKKNERKAYLILAGTIIIGMILVFLICI